METLRNPLRIIQLERLRCPSTLKILKKTLDNNWQNSHSGYSKIAKTHQRCAQIWEFNFGSFNSWHESLCCGHCGLSDEKIPLECWKSHGFYLDKKVDCEAQESVLRSVGVFEGYLKENGKSLSHGWFPKTTCDVDMEELLMNNTYLNSKIRNFDRVNFT